MANQQYQQYSGNPNNRGYSYQQVTNAQQTASTVQPYQHYAPAQPTYSVLPPVATTPAPPAAYTPSNSANSWYARHQPAAQSAPTQQRTQPTTTSTATTAPTQQGRQPTPTYTQPQTQPTATPVPIPAPAAVANPQQQQPRISAPPTVTPPIQPAPIPSQTQPTINQAHLTGINSSYDHTKDHKQIPAGYEAAIYDLSMYTGESHTGFRVIDYPFGFFNRTMRGHINQKHMLAMIEFFNGYTDDNGVQHPGYRPGNADLPQNKQNLFDALKFLTDILVRHRIPLNNNGDYFSSTMARKIHRIIYTNGIQDKTVLPEYIDWQIQAHGALPKNTVLDRINNTPLAGATKTIAQWSVDLGYWGVKKIFGWGN